MGRIVREWSMLFGAFCGDLFRRIVVVNVIQFVRRFPTRFSHLMLLVNVGACCRDPLSPVILLKIRIFLKV